MWYKFSQIEEQKEPWEMTVDEIYAHSKTLEPKERFSSFIKPISKMIKERAGETVEDIVAHYCKKYDLPNIPITREPSENGYASLRVVYDNYNKLKRWSLNITPEAENKKSFPFWLRHELEHAIDVYNGFRGTPSAVQLPNGEWSTKGHHKRFDQFEIGYPHRQFVKQALSEGKLVPFHIIDEFLANGGNLPQTGLHSDIKARYR